MALALKAFIDTIRTVAHGSITNSLVALGAPFGHQVRMMRIINNTDGDMLFSTDGTNNMLFVPAGSFVLYDVTTNRESQAETFVFAVGTQMYIQYNSSPSKGDVWLECIYGQGE